MLKLIVIITLIFGLNGCFFWSDESFEQNAFLHSGEEAKHIIEIRGTSWYTGNMHIPFDFTVYETDKNYEIRVASLDGLVDAKDIELFMCGHKLSGVTGNILVLGEKLSVALEYGPLDVPDKRSKLHGNFQLIPAAGQSQAWSCGHRKR
jgi:hypothetical protein